MGLDLSVGGKSCGRWSYSGFGEFRKKVASQVGIDLFKMEGYHNVDKNILNEKGWDAYDKAIKEFDYANQIPWENIDDPIVPLLNHSDCDGTLEPEVCGPLADRLEEIIKDWPDTITFATDEAHRKFGYPEIMTIDNYDKVNAEKLIEGMRYAVEINQPVEFH